MHMQCIAVSINLASTATRYSHAIWDHTVLPATLQRCESRLYFPLPSNRQHLSCGYCLKGKRGDYLTSSVLLCIIIVHIICTPI